MNLPDNIKTISSETEFRLKEKGSLFISISKPIQTEEDANSFLHAIRKKYYDATHHCYSYKLVNGNYKYSDDGEPNGTAGIRIYNAQNHFDLTNLVTIVIRFFGGVKLGVGPLGKTYYLSAIQNLENSPKQDLALYKTIEIEYPFELSQLVHYLIGKYQLIMTQNLFEIKPKMICSILNKSIEKFSSELSSGSKNEIEIKIMENHSYIRT
jgi:uncharacterized YigZ family protein